MTWKSTQWPPKPFQYFIDPDAQDFVAPGNIPERIRFAVRPARASRRLSARSCAVSMRTSP